MNARDQTALDARDTLTGYDQLRETKRYPPAPRQKPAGSFRIDLTERQKKELEQYIKDNDLPF